MDKNIIRYKGRIDKRDRNRLNTHDSGVIWFTGLSASGKSTIAHLLEEKLHDENIRAYVFDGDNIRRGLNSNLGFSLEDRVENIRRIVEVARLFVDAGTLVLASFITPLRTQRAYIRERLSGMKYLEVYVKCDIGECIRRDPKGFYKKALEGTIKNYTGVSSPFEEPENPDLVIESGTSDIEACVSTLLDHLRTTRFLALATPSD